MGRRRGTVAAALAVLVAAPLAITGATAQDVRLPVLVPLTGFVALEGTSQRNGALLAASQIREVSLKPEVLDTQSTPEAAVTAWERAMGGALPLASVATLLFQFTVLTPLIVLTALGSGSRLFNNTNVRFSEIGNCANTVLTRTR